MLIVQNRIEKLKNELLLFSRQQLDLLELALKLQSLSGFGFGCERFASQEFGDRNIQRGGGAFDEIECLVRRAMLVVINKGAFDREFVGKLLLRQSFAAVNKRERMVLSFSWGI